MSVSKISLISVILLSIVFSACEMQTEELVELNTLEPTEHDKRIDAENAQLPEPTQAEIEDAEFESELEKAMEEAQIEEDYNLVREMEDLDEAKKSGKAAKGSCNAIAEASTCLEYYGSFWTPTQMELNCSDSGVYSTQPCPEGSLGGCNVGKGGMNDMVTWFYNYGGSPLGDSLQYAQKACNATPMTIWINAK